ncbi:ABC transporter ATP-binding protein [Alkaliphilus hydrothermalis]|uniref:ABC-2 type transport system ATP-binding protein n=1 Tax=Alkaliphilus hydrothermalis TaxID=1482730 RepID=A0ABS2NRX2_9FIRM|nr:ABC-2 type transport system ATP-binding protein [Alkaliphilus hydrothermalis]
MSIKLTNVVKRYDSKLAVDQVSLNIQQGEIFGLLGPNGAGKSTTIKMIMGLLKPNSGEIIVHGLDIKSKSMEVKKLLGMVPQDIAIYDNISARENVGFFGSLYGLRGKELKKAVDEALEYTGLLDRQKEKPKKFSGGMKRRLNIACAIVHKPEIIIMDEPTVGIDPQSRNHILESVRELNRRGATVIYTSHYMEEVENLCHRVGIIDHGKLIALGTKEELKMQMNQEQLIQIEASDIRFNVVNEIKKLQGVINVSVKENILEVLTKNAQQLLQDILFVMGKGNTTIRNISLQEPDLESVFLSLTGRTLRD